MAHARTSLAFGASLTDDPSASVADSSTELYKYIRGNDATPYGGMVVVGTEADHQVYLKLYAGDYYAAHRHHYEGIIMAHGAMLDLYRDPKSYGGTSEYQYRIPDLDRAIEILTAFRAYEQGYAHGDLSRDSLFAGIISEVSEFKASLLSNPQVVPEDIAENPGASR